jgi:hypothetical protein
MPRATKGDLKISFQRVDAKARRARETAVRRGYQTATRTVPVVEERTVESLWHDKKPEGWNFLDWHRAWNNGEPTEEHVELYNSLWPDEDERHIALVEDDD